MTQPATTERVVRTGLAELRRLHAAWDQAWSLHLGYGPDGIDYRRDRLTGTRVDDDRLGPLRLTGTDVEATDLSRDYNASAIHLARALQHAACLSWTNGAPPALPSGHVTAAAGARLLRDAHLALIGAEWRACGRWEYHASWSFIGPLRRWVQPGLDLADDVHTRAMCAGITAALQCMPADLHVTPSRPVEPTTKRCIGGPGRKHCPTQIPWRTDPGYCDVCGPRVTDLVAEHPAHRGDPCRDPWDRDVCRGTVAVPKFGLCASCDQFRRNVIRQTAA